MSRFGADPHGFFDEVYRRDPAPWDIGEPQPAMAALLAAHPPFGPVLDLGCGSGDLAIHLAQRGLEVLGIDFVAAAIEQARARASTLPAEVARRVVFQVTDGLHPSRLGQQFGAVMDCGFFHLFDPATGDALIEEIASTLRPGGFFYLLAFDVEFAIPNAPRQVSAEEVQARFTAEQGWHIRALHATEFRSRMAAPVAATSACIERLPVGDNG